MTNCSLVDSGNPTRRKVRRYLIKRGRLSRAETSSTSIDPIVSTAKRPSFFISPTTWPLLCSYQFLFLSLSVLFTCNFFKWLFACHTLSKVKTLLNDAKRPRFSLGPKILQQGILSSTEIKFWNQFFPFFLKEYFVFFSFVCLYLATWLCFLGSGWVTTEEQKGRGVVDGRGFG